MYGLFTQPCPHGSRYRMLMADDNNHDLVKIFLYVLKVYLFWILYLSTFQFFGINMLV